MSDVSSTNSSSWPSWSTFNQYGHIGGLASGLDTDSIIKGLMTAASVPLDKLNQNKQIWEWKQDDYRSVNSTLLDFRNTVFNMKLQGTFLEKTTTSSDPTIVTATASSVAGNATYTISNITSLATSASVVSSNTVTKSGQTQIDPTQSLASQLNSQKLNWTGPTSGSSFSLTINGETFTFDTNQDSLNTMIAKINGDAKAGVTVYYDAVTDKMVMTTTATGASAKIQVTNDTTNVARDLFGMNVLADGSLSNDGTKAATGQDANFTINGLQTHSSSNTINVNGMTITLKNTTASPVTVQASPDVDKIYNAIKDFVDKYNSTIDTINKMYTEPRYSDYPPLTDAQKAQMTDTQIQQWEAKAKSGLLKGDDLLGSVLDNMRMAMGSQVNGVTSVSGYNTLSQIGITTGQWYENGKLYIDEDKLRSAIQNDPNGVMQLFTNSGTDPVTGSVDKSKQGIAVQLYDALNNAINQIGQTAGNSTDLTDNSFIGQTIKGINEQIAAMQDQLNQLQQRYVQQYTALEETMAQLNSQSQYLLSSFSNG
jgi:flagellar hook-associated protein 2